MKKFPKEIFVYICKNYLEKIDCYILSIINRTFYQWLCVDEDVLNWKQPKFIAFRYQDDFRNDEYQIISQFKKCFVAGGHALRCYTNADWEDDRDIDVFFYNQTREEWRNQLKKVIQNLASKQWNTMFIEAHSSYRDLTKLYKHNSNRRIDLIYAGKYKDPISILEDFDLDICSVGFVIKPDLLGYHFFYTDQFQKSLLTKICHVHYDPNVTKNPLQKNIVINKILLKPECIIIDDNTPLVWNIRLKDRINKYTKRGFEIKSIPVTYATKYISYENKEKRRKLNHLCNYHN